MKKKVNIIVGICSWIGARDKRDAVRRTWLQYSQQGIECLFFTGGGISLSSEELKDTVLLDAPDGYNELPAKVFSFFRYALENYDFNWLFKCDDDTYLDLSRLSDLTLPEYDLIGDVMLDQRKAPSGGAGYFLSRTMVKKIVAQPSLPSVGAEDLIVGNMVVRLGGRFLSTGRLYMNNVYYPDEENDMVSCHWCTPDILDAIHTFNHQEPGTIYMANNPCWTDEVLFFANGTFRRRSTSCYGRWSFGERGELTLKWQMWPMEQLVPREGNYVGSSTILVRQSNNPTLSDLVGTLPQERDGHTIDAEGVFIHLGCGRRRLFRWLNLDLPHYDISKPLPWNDHEVDAYFLEHAIEQLDASQVYDFFKEVRRTLKPGGILRLSVTDIQEFIRKQTPALLQYQRAKSKIASSSTGGVYEVLLKAHGNRSFWTKESITCVLKDLGFTITFHEVGISEHPHLQGLEYIDDRDENPFDHVGSICLEAKKPGHISVVSSTTKKNRRNRLESYVTPKFQLGHRTGNRLFQVAAVYAHALRYDLECRIPWRHSPEISDLFDHLREDAKPCPNGGYDSPIVYKEPNFSYTPIPSGAINGALEGFFQSERYFDDVEREVRSLFRSLTLPRRQGVAGVHIRLGDYLERTDMYHIPNDSFLSEALEKLSRNIREIIVFSDMPEKARSLLEALPAAHRFILRTDNNDTLGALKELTAMEELILSCSSFSWWGAWLGDQDRVFIQKHWFAGGADDDRDVYRRKWVKL